MMYCKPSAHRRDAVGSGDGHGAQPLATQLLVRQTRVDLFGARDDDESRDRRAPLVGRTHLDRAGARQMQRDRLVRLAGFADAGLPDGVGSQLDFIVAEAARAGRHEELRVEWDLLDPGMPSHIRPIDCDRCSRSSIHNEGGNQRRHRHNRQGSAAHRISEPRGTVTQHRERHPC